MQLRPDQTVSLHVRYVDRYYANDFGKGKKMYDEVRWETKKTMINIDSQRNGGIPVLLGIPEDGFCTGRDPRAREEIRWMLNAEVKDSGLTPVFCFGVKAATRKRKKS